MVKDILSATFYDPLYNLLTFLIDIVPGGNVGFAVILLTILVKIVLFPVIIKGMRTQMLLRTLEPKLKEIKEKFKSNTEEQARATLALYRENHINPFSVLVPILIQTPFLLALFFIFSHGGLPVIKADILYSFVPLPNTISMHFLGFFDVSERSILLALASGVSQYVYGILSLPKLEPRKHDASFKDDFARSFQMNIRYILPAIIAVFAYSLPSAVAIYWITGNIFGSFQELYVRREFRKKTSQTI